MICADREIVFFKSNTLGTGVNEYPVFRIHFIIRVKINRHWRSARNAVCTFVNLILYRVIKESPCT